MRVTSSPAFGHIGASEYLDLIFTASTLGGSPHDSLYVFEPATSTLIWKRELSECGSCSPIIANLDGSASPEIVVWGDGKIWVLNGQTGTAEWYYSVDGIVKKPAIADIDKDGDLEILASTTEGKLYIIHDANTANIYEFPKGIHTSPVVVDVDGDQILDIFISTERGSYAYDINGNDLFNGFIGRGTHASPMACDIDNNAKLNIISDDIFGRLYAWEFEGSRNEMLWSKERKDIYNSGNYDLPPIAPIGLKIVEVQYTQIPGRPGYYFIVHMDWLPNAEHDLLKYNLYRRISPYEPDYIYIKSSYRSEIWDTVMQYPPYYPGYGVYVYYHVKAEDVILNESEASNTVGFWMWPPSEPSSPASAKFIIAGLGNPEPSPYLVQRAGYRVIDSNHDINLYPEYSVDYHPERLVYRFTGLDPAKEYWIAAILCRGHDDPATIERMYMDGIPVLTNLTVVDTPRLVYHRIPHILYTDSVITIELRRISGGPAIASELILAEVVRTPGYGGTMTSNEITKFDISEVSPNPATSHVTIKLAVPYRAYVRLNIYDVTGRLVKPLVNSMLNPGYHTVKWDIENVPMGIYFLKLQNERLAVTKKLVIIK